MFLFPYIVLRKPQVSRACTWIFVFYADGLVHTHGIRDYVHVSDLVDAHVLGLKWLQSGHGSRVFNLGTGDGFSVRQVIDQAKHVNNRPVPFTHGARRPGDCTKLVSGSLRAKKELGW